MLVMWQVEVWVEVVEVGVWFNKYIKQNLSETFVKNDTSMLKIYKKKQQHIAYLRVW